jgi:Ca-activated chloride channel family protein
MHIQKLLGRKKYARALAAGCVALAAGGIFLLRAPRGTSAATPDGSGSLRITTPSGAPKAEFAGPWLRGSTALAQGRVLAHGTRHVLAEIRLTAERGAPQSESRPAALAVVLDVSGSMSGAKLEQARGALLELVNRMRDFDQIALVTYSDAARVVQPLARVGEVRNRLRMVIPTIQIEGGTNIPSGLELGVSSLALAPADMVRRVVLLSDGQDGSGRPLEQITGEVRARANQGITLSSLGIGADYDERFMSQVADAGRGNYEFLRDGSQLRTFLARELQQATSTTIERAVAEITLPRGWRLSHAVGAEAERVGDVVRLPIGALFAGDERRVVLDLEVDAGAAGQLGALDVAVAYHAVPEHRDVRLAGGHLALHATESESDALASRDATVIAEAESALVAVRQQEAVNAWRAGRRAEAEAITARNIATLNAVAPAAPGAAPALAAQLQQLQRDQSAFRSLAADSEEGRAYGLGSNARHRAGAQRATAY